MAHPTDQQTETSQAAPVTTPGGLEPFFTPRSVAIIGATDAPGKLGAALVANMESYGAPVYYVNPGRDEVAGEKAWPSVKDLPETVDLAVVLVPASRTVKVVTECVEAGVPGVLIESGGFVEGGEKGRQWEEQLKALVGRGTRLWGPNCTGIVNNLTGMKATFMGLPEVKQGRAALVGQSGILAGGLLIEVGETDAFGVSAVAALGNKIDVNENDVLAHLANDPRVGVVGCYLETVDRPRALVELAREMCREKPLVLLRGAITDSGAQAGLTHTGKLVKPNYLIGRNLERSGVTLADDFMDLINKVRAFAYLNGRAAPERFAIVSTSGGAAVALIDQLSQVGGKVAELEEGTLERLREAGVTGEDHAPNQPLDLELAGEIHGITHVLSSSLKALSADPNVDGVFLIQGALDHFADLDASAVAEALAGTDTPVFTWLYGRRALKQKWMKALHERMAFFNSLARGVRSVTAVRRWQEWVRSEEALPEEEAAEPLVELPPPPGGRTVLHEGDLRELLAGLELPFVNGRFVTSVEEIEGAARELQGPLVLKAQAAQALHKSEFGAVVLGLESGAAAAEEAARIAASLPEPMGEGDGWLLQEMVDGAFEVLLGAGNDRDLGPMVTLGVGGFLVEVLGETASGLAPLTRSDFDELLGETKLGMLLRGVRGQRPYDVDALWRLTRRVGEIVASNPQIREIEFNPVMVLPEGQGVRIVDARAVVE